MDQIDMLIAADGKRRAVISHRPDGVFQVIIERQIAGDGLYEPRSYWSRETGGPSLVSSLQQALDVARAHLGTGLRSAVTEE